jgi:hypothetical protein
VTDGGAEQRLAAIYAEISRLRLRALVMGGHAVRFYGVDRSTVDFDLAIALAAAEWSDLPRILSGSPLLSAAREGPSWRPDDFRRFEIGSLPDGRPERLEFWRRNHLLAPFSELDARKTVGPYGGGTVGFLGLDDLIRSKETEREDDWRDVRLLEEIADERRLASPARGDHVSALAAVRSTRGFETARRQGILASNEATRHAAAAAAHPVTRAFLAPYAATVPIPETIGDEGLRALLTGVLTTVEPGSARHLALVEAVRRLHQRSCMAADRADKERSAGMPPGPR